MQDVIFLCLLTRHFLFIQANCNIDISISLEMD